MASGTKMAFAGEKDDKKRADILAYLQSLRTRPFRSRSEARLSFGSGGIGNSDRSHRSLDADDGSPAHPGFRGLAGAATVGAISEGLDA